MTPEQRRNLILSLLLIILIVGVVTVAVLLLPQLSKPRSPTLAPQPVQAEQPITPQQTVSKMGGKYFYAGMPKPTATFSHAITIITNIAYVVGYDEVRHDPAWVCFRLFKVGNLKPPKRTGSFRVDSRTASHVSPTVYAKTGYDLGHCAPDKAISLCYGPDAVAETYEMSNVLPETPELNRHSWMLLEKTEIEQYSQRFEETWTITGPIFDEHPKTLANGVQIPKFLYRIIVDEENGSPRVLAFMIPQTVSSTEKANDYATSVDEIEKETGLDFLTDLPDDVENRLEAVTNRMW